MITVNKYRKKPVVIEAVKFDRFHNRPAIEFLGLHKDGCRKGLSTYWENEVAIFQLEDPGSSILRIKTLEGLLNVSDGDYIIKGIQGEFYPCKPDIFEETYELA